MDLDTDEDGWVKDHPVYCPVTWCNAHKVRTLRCGDSDGDYEGIHIARIKYVKRFNAAHGRRVEELRAMGLEKPELLAGFERLRQDSVDFGFLPGIKGKRRL